MPSMVTRPVITSMANAIRLHWRRVVAVTWGWKQWKSATISTIGALRCGVGVVVLYNATLHDNGPPYLIFGEGIVYYVSNFVVPAVIGRFLVQFEGFEGNRADHRAVVAGQS